MDILGKLKPQVDDAEVLKLQKNSTSIGFENNRLKSSQSAESRGTAIRVIKEGRLGFSASSDDRVIDQLIDNVLESATYGDKVPLRFPDQRIKNKVNNYDQKIVGLSIPKMVEMGQELIEAVLGFDPDVKVNVNIEREIRQFSLKNQAGFNDTYQSSPLSIEIDILRVQEDDILNAWSFEGTTLWFDEYLELANKLVKLLGYAKENVTLKPGRMPVLFSPKGSFVLAMPIFYGLDGKNVYAGISPMSGKLGEKLFDEKLTIMDDPTLPGRYNTAPFDGEGVAAQQNTFIDKGSLKGFYYDLKTAALSGVEPTGNGARSLFKPPEPAITNFMIQPGETPLADIIKGIDKGLWVEGLMGLGQGNIVSGAFSNPVGLGYKIEKGEIVGRVKDVSIAGNIYDLLPKISAISQETDWVYRDFCFPHILIEDMNVVA
jgi:PmbA protein